MKIRKATIKDLDTIAKLLLEYNHYESKLNKNVKKHTFKQIKSAEKTYMTTGTTYFIAEDKEKPIGVLDVDIDLRGKEKIGFLHTLIITKDARGKGYGNKIVKHALNYFKKNGCRRVKTFIHIANQNALKFWKRKGFETEKGYTAVKRI